MKKKKLNRLSIGKLKKIARKAKRDNKYSLFEEIKTELFEKMNEDDFREFMTEFYE